MMYIQEKFNKVSPYLRGIRYSDDSLLPLISIIIPVKWVYTNLSDVVVQETLVNENTRGIIIGHRSDEDGADTVKPIDFFFNLIENTIKINKEIEQKELLLQEKIKELQKFVESQSIDEIEKLQIYKQDLTVSINNSEVEHGKMGVSTNDDVEEERILKPFNIDTEDVPAQPVDYDIIELPQVIKDIQEFNKQIEE